MNMNKAKQYKLTYTYQTDLGDRQCSETFRYFETVLQVLKNLNEHCSIDDIKIKVVY